MILTNAAESASRVDTFVPRRNEQGVDVSDSTSLSVPAAGWYPDRSDPRVSRWWDGQQWTDHMREAASVVAASVVQPVSASAFALPVTEPPGPSTAPVAAPATVAPTVAHAAIPAGWYADNTDARLQRWWNGAQWTTHTASRTGAQASAAAVASPASGAYQPDPSYALARGSMDGAAVAVNSLATRGMIYSLIALVLNPLFIMSIGGFVNGIRSLRRAPNFLPANARRGQAIAAIVVGVVATLLSIVALVSAYQVYAAAHAGTYTRSLVQEHIRLDLSTRLAADVASVSCPAHPPIQSGTTFLCTATIAADGSTLPVTGKFVSDTGAYTWTAPPLLDGTVATIGGAPETIAGMKQTISQGLDDHGATVTEVDCPAGAATEARATFVCTVTMSDERTAPIGVVVDASGSTWSYGYGAFYSEDGTGYDGSPATGG